MKQSCQSRNWFVYANKPTSRLTSHAIACENSEEKRMFSQASHANDFGNAKIKAMRPRKKARRARHGHRYS